MSYGPFNWSNPQFENSTYHKWTQEGDTIEGVIVGMSTVTFPAKDDQAEATYPVLVIDTAAGEKELTVSGVDLLHKTVKLAPQIGDWYSAAWIATAGKKRIFLVNVKKEPAATARSFEGVGKVDATRDELAARAEAKLDDEVPF